MPTGPADFRGPIEQARRRFADLQPGVLAIVSRADPAHFLGRIGWRFESDPEMGVADIGYSVHPATRGRGVATAAVVLAQRWLMYDDSGPRVARVQLDHSVENLASCRVAVAAGLPVEGVRRGLLPLRDASAPGGVRRHDVCLHGTVAEELGG
jgi:RimJ/RimL family protein N-acetyltransferase